MRLRPNIIVGVTAVIVFLILLSLAQEMNQRWQIQREIQRLETQAKAMQTSVIELENLNQYFRTDDYQERLAREKLNYRAAGEEVVLIPDAAGSDEVVNELEQRPADNKYSLPMKWWRLFFVDEPVA